MKPAWSIPGSADRERLLRSMAPSERCVNRILDQALIAASNPGKELETYKAALRVLEEYVKDELERRLVARSVSNTDAGHTTEAAEILRDMRDSSFVLSRLRDWYVRDMEKGATR